jgi:hypothetical protein
MSKEWNAAASGPPTSTLTIIGPSQKGVKGKGEIFSVLLSKRGGERVDHTSFYLSPLILSHPTPAAISDSCSGFFFLIIVFRIYLFGPKIFYEMVF